MFFFSEIRKHQHISTLYGQNTEFFLD